LVAALVGVIVVVSGAAGGIAFASGASTAESPVLAAAGPGDGYISTFSIKSPSPNTEFAVSYLRLPPGNFMVSMTGEGYAGTNAVASLSCSFSTAIKGYVPYGVNLDGSGRTIGALAGVNLPSGGTLTLSCKAGMPAGKFVFLSGALSAVHVAALTG
jgi:hypothetical protein